jgi:hypothetical protein
MRKRKLIPLTSYDQEPEGMTEDEAHEFWSTHAFTEEYIASAPPVPDDVLPPISPLQEFGPIHLSFEVFRRARWLARRRGLSVEEYVGKLIHQELAAEEKRIRGTGSRTASDAGRGS